MNKKRQQRSSRIGEMLFRFVLPEAERHPLMGDYEELYKELSERRGRIVAGLWYWVQVLASFHSSIGYSLKWSGIMLRNNVVIAWRNIKKSRVYSAVNVLGLAVGLAVFILIMLFVRYELSYDRYHDNARNIYRILREDPELKFMQSHILVSTPGPLAEAMVNEFPEVRAAARISSRSTVHLSLGNDNFMVKNFLWADPQLFDIFSFPLVRGDKDAVFGDPYSILLSQRAARRYFGDVDPIGRTVAFHHRGKTFDFRVNGIFRDVPANSHFVMDVVAPFETMAKIIGHDLTDWRLTILSYATYILLDEGTDPKAIDSKLLAFRDNYIAQQTWPHREQETRYFLQPVSRIHLHSLANFDYAALGDFRFVLLFATIAVLVLMIACVNYMNLATARSLRRTKEVGLRKVIGAARSQLTRQFLGEALILTILALTLAVGLVLTALPVFKTIVEREIVFNPFRDPVLIPGLAFLVVVVGLIAGSYPAIFVSAFRPVAALKGMGGSRTKVQGLRNVLIVFQFVASITLIICTVGVHRQIRFIHNRDMGYERQQIVVLEPDTDMRKSLDAFKAELRRNPAVLGAAASSGLPNNIYEFGPDKNNNPRYTLQADYDFVDLFGLKIVQGRNFSRALDSDAGSACLINESASAILGWDDPVGRPFSVFGHDDSPRPIVGVLKDFHLHSLHLPIMPLVIVLHSTNVNYISIKIRGDNIPQTMAFIRETWKRFEPNHPFTYSFFNEIFDRDYRDEERMGTIFSTLGALALLIACLGLIGLASLTAEQRTKEIGIRKVLGASVHGILTLLSRGFTKWIILANLIAWPIAYYFMNKWLQNFAYRTGLSIWVFMLSGLAVLAIALLTVGYQTVKAATANPVEALRYE